MSAYARSVGKLVTFGMKPTASKYKNVTTIQDGERFDSKREAARYKQLQFLEKANLIRDLKRQVEFKLEVAGQLITKYRADFTYEEYKHSEWVKVVEDSKGALTPIYRLKRKLMKAIHGIEIRET
jgi:predicted DNA-binding transcriptional regulator